MPSPDPAALPDPNEPDPIESDPVEELDDPYIHIVSTGEFIEAVETAGQQP